MGAEARAAAPTTGRPAPRRSEPTLQPGLNENPKRRIQRSKRKPLIRPAVVHPEPLLRAAAYPRFDLGIDGRHDGEHVAGCVAGRNGHERGSTVMRKWAPPSRSAATGTSGQPNLRPNRATASAVMVSRLKNGTAIPSLSFWSTPTWPPDFEPAQELTPAFATLRY